MKAHPPLVVLLLAALLALAAPAAAQDKSFDLPRADVVAEVQPDGSVLVTERITYDFTGHFEGGYREIPLQEGMSVDGVSVSEGGEQYRPGASAQLGSKGAPNTFGTADLGERYRIVWHYRATDEQRTFEIRYRLQGLAVAYDDVVDVYLQVWGDEWDEPLRSLEAEVVLPGGAERGEVKVFGHPASVDGETSLGSDGVSPQLHASDVPAGQFVEIRVVFPGDVLTSTQGARVEPGSGLQEILDEEAADARTAWLLALQPLFALLLVLVSVGIMTLVYLLYGRERKAEYNRKYEQEPPTDDPPAVVSSIIDQRPSVGTKEFVATLFDLIRRGALKAEPVSVENGGLWGRETITDLRVRLGDPVELNDYEREVMDVAKRVLADGPVLLTDFKDLMRKDASTNRESYERFRHNLKLAVEQRNLVERGPGRWLGVLTLVLGVLGATWFFLSVFGLFFGGILSFFLIFVIAPKISSRLTPAWVRRTPKGALLHARWQAFRSYLEDFSRIGDAPPASLALWEKFLVYGIALGVADLVLEAARLHAPAEVVANSTMYWTDSDGHVHVPDAFSFAAIENDFSRAFTPPSSSSSGSGGSFSGSGGGGGGGGGGGAW